MITLQELCRSLNDLLEVQNFKDSCENGLQVEGPEKIYSVATAVSASLATIQQACALGVQALIVHHGLFWERDPYSITGTKKEKLNLLFDNKISLLAYHLPLDSHRELGNNWKAASELGWKDLEPFGWLNGNFIGVKGKFSPISRNDFQKSLESYYLHPAHSALGGKGNVESAALVSGGAYRMLSAAAKENVDCFITGNFDEPAWHLAFEEKINFFAMGHSATEKVGVKTLGNYLSRQYDLQHTFIDVPNPF